MKILKYILLSSVLAFTNCTDIIEVEPQSYILDNGSYSLFVAQNLLQGAYASLRTPKQTEWALTEVMSDNTYNNVVGTADPRRLELIKYDTFGYDAEDRSFYLGPYWLASYTSIRAANTVIQGVGYTYDATSKSLAFKELQVPEISAKSLAAEACFIRAYNYFNLVRMFGSIPLVHEPFVTPRDAYGLSDATISQVYDLIVTDLKFTIDNGITENYNNSAIPSNIGKANKWAAAALLAKVYLTLGDKASAKVQLESIIGTTVSATGIRGYGLETSYANVFSNSNKMNKEILFSVRFSSANVTVGNTFTEIFAGVGQATPSVRTENGVTEELYNAYSSTDARRNVTILKGAVPTSATVIQRYFLTKYYSSVTATGLGANDWPVIRYSDVLLMYAEALGNTPTAVQFINLVRTRAGATAYATTMTNAAFEKALFDERRLELAGENQRWFDLLRLNATSTNGFNLKTHMINHLTNAYDVFYNPDLKVSLSNYVNNINSSSLLLPIPSTQTQN